MEVFMRKQVEEALDKIRPALQRDGGDVVAFAGDDGDRAGRGTGGIRHRHRPAVRIGAVGHPRRASGARAGAFRVPAETADGSRTAVRSNTAG